MLPQILSRFDAQLALAIAIVYSLNVLLTAAKKLLDRYAASSEADQVITKLCVILSKGLEFVTANSSALPPKSKAELDAEQQQG